MHRDEPSRGPGLNRLILIVGSCVIVDVDIRNGIVGLDVRYHGPANLCEARSCRKSKKKSQKGVMSPAARSCFHSRGP
jgi:hypothetical protein